MAEQHCKFSKEIYLLYCAPIITRNHPVVIMTPYHGPDCLIMGLQSRNSKSHQHGFYLTAKKEEHVTLYNYVPEESFQN